MERIIYTYTCMGCGANWDSTIKEDFCHICGCPDIAEEIEDDENIKEA